MKLNVTIASEGHKIIDSDDILALSRWSNRLNPYVQTRIVFKKVKGESVNIYESLEEIFEMVKDGL